MLVAAGVPEVGVVGTRDLLLLSVLMSTSCFHEEVPVSPTEWVTDPNHFLSQSRLVVDEGGRWKFKIGYGNAINARLQAYEQLTKHQLIVWIADKDVDGPLPQFCQRAHNAWGVGRRGYNDGIIIFLFPVGDRFRMWISVGRGLDQILTDQESSRISYLYGPIIEKGDRNEGLNGLINEIIAVIGPK